MTSSSLGAEEHSVAAVAVAAVDEADEADDGDVVEVQHQADVAFADDVVVSSADGVADAAAGGGAFAVDDVDVVAVVVVVIVVAAVAAPSWFHWVDFVRAALKVVLQVF